MNPEPPYNQPQPPQRSGMPIWAIVLLVLGAVGVLFCILSAAVLFPVFSQAKHAALASKTLSEAKEVTIAAVLFTADHDDKFPAFDSASHVATQLNPYLKKNPDIQAKLPNYQWNPKLSNIDCNKLKNAADVWMCETGPDDQNNVFIGFCDAHVKKFKQDQEARIKAVEPEFEK